MIIDPTNPNEAIAPSGHLAAKVFFIPAAESPATLTPAEIEEAIEDGSAHRIGWADPADLLP